MHERPATTPVPVKSDTKAAASKQVQNVKERPVTVSKEQPQSSRTKEPVTKPQENIRTQVVRESSPAGNCYRWFTTDSAEKIANKDSSKEKYNTIYCEKIYQ